MKRFVVERSLPGPGHFSPQRLQSVTQTSREVIDQMIKPCYWIQSFVIDSELYCVDIAGYKETFNTLPRIFPVNRIKEMRASGDSQQRDF